ncbi:RagB/SusD family nutrient uptake outer membrane protein [Flectobacillus roseus]|uniref:RagB/SusD family nutrient uptake outer membrane protein n=1 Tax=Flectobacillus roseus TaxID=502259 RepID=A0ABT6Y8W3_9BACT|nr:RagB/SusD family nutrient uptake outer membrane protein [Flectobacillus roseus]MDI9860018.1 RagB/SusD family nutrient uptake outer membrane protein [Flectobacillus roseus]MDI9869028.1 RagB/SusD family nutrient uptake outer membrane protein [Flectobacillus roseus]
MKKPVIFLSLLASLIAAQSCTNLEEQVLDESFSPSISYADIANGTLAPVYALLPSIFLHTNYFAIQEISTDEAILPYRGGTDWGDNGIYLALHQHTQTSTDPNLKNTWNFILQGISRSVSAINEFQGKTDATSQLYLAESRGMRAYYSMLTLDLFGVVFVKNSVGETSKVIRGAEAVEYIKSELLAVEPNLSTTVGPGRLNKAAAWGLLARLYLNAAVYRNVTAQTVTFSNDDLDKVIEYTDKIINSNQYQLSPEYFSIFNSDNHSNKEIIFAVDQRAELNGHNRLAYFSLSGDQFPLPAFPAANGTDGPAITSDYYRTWVNAYGSQDPSVDPRFYKQNLSIYSNPADSCVTAESFNINRGILRGQQYGLIRKNGVFLKCPDGKMKVGKLFNDTRNRPTTPVIFTEKVDFTVAGSDYSTGYRVEKYEFSKKSTSGRNLGDADIVILRLADVYMMRAEAKLRKSNDAASALADVNTVRASRKATTPPPALTSMSLDLLYRERGFEFYWEMLRRTDMIRFGKYEDTWTEKTNTDRNKRIFPIPQTAIDGASNLPGYLVQNPSY